MGPKSVTVILTNYCCISYQHSGVYQSAKFCANIKTLKFGTKNV